MKVIIITLFAVLLWSCCSVTLTMGKVNGGNETRKANRRQIHAWKQSRKKAAMVVEGKMKKIFNANDRVKKCRELKQKLAAVAT